MRVGRALGAAVLLVCGQAAAQDREADAERLFREGQKLLEERRYGEACPKFEAAYRKDGQLGTLINLAFCHKEQGANWYAWLEFREAEIKATELGRPDRKDFVRKQLTLLEKNLPKVIVDNPRKEPLVEVLVEDKRVPEAERGAVFAAEPGERKFTFRAKGKKQATLLVPVQKIDKIQHVTTPELEDAPPEELAPPPAEPAPPEPAPQPERPAPEAPRGDTQRILSYGLLGLGAAAVGVGSVFGVMTLDNVCSGDGAKTPQCTADEKARGDRTGMISNVSFAVGGAALIGGVVLLLTAPSSSPTAGSAPPRRRVAVTPELGAGWAGVRGTF